MNYRICGLFILINFISFWSNAQFADPMLLNPGSRAGFFGYADLNNDGTEDIYGYGSQQFFIYPGFEEGFDHLIVQSLSFPNSVDLENQDINQDGYTDISLSSGYFPNVNFSLGNFITYPSIDASISRTKLADMDGDNIPDIVRYGLNSSSPSTCIFHIFRNTGSGDFELINTLSATTTLSEFIRFIDMDADGLDDIVYKSNDVVLYQRNSGDGVFEESIVLTDEYDIPVIGDWNNDQKMDYVNFTSTGIEVYFQTTPFAFDLIQQISLNETTSPLTNFASYPQVDYNGDGFIDLAMRSQDGLMRILLNDGTGIFSASNTTNHPHLNNQFRWDDLNNDQKADLIELGVGVFISKQNETGDLVYSEILDNQFNNNEQPLDANGFSMQPYNFITLDIENDERDEIIGQMYNGIIQVENQMDGNPHLFAPLSRLGGMNVIGQKDMNDDMITDIILQRPFTTTLVWVERDAAGNWLTSHEITGLTNYGSISIHDINNDQEKEQFILSGNNEFLVHQLIYNTAESSVSLQPISSFSNDNEEYATPKNGMNFGDFNDDGLVDIGITKAGSLRILSNNGDGTFTTIAPPREITAGELLCTFSNKSADVNGDNIADFIFLAFNGANSTSYIGICSYQGGEYLITTIPMPYNNNYNVTYYSMDDVNADSFVDLIIPVDNVIEFWMGNGNGEFALNSEMTVSTPDMPIAQIRTIHLNEDTLPDLLVETGDSQNYTNTITYYLLNKAQSPFHLNYTCFADLNMNGEMDLDEYPITQLPIEFSGNHGVLFTDHEGNIKLNAQPGEVVASIQPSTQWTPTTPTTSAITLDDTSPAATVKFGLAPTGTIHSVTSFITTTINTCDGNGTIWLSLKNTGNTIASGTFGINYDPLLTTTLYSEAPASMNENNLQWAYNSLNPGQTITISIQVDTPPLEGEVALLNHSSFATILDMNNNVLFNEEQLFSEDITCDGMANDIQEHAGWSTEGYVMASQPLQFSILFQNQNTPTIQTFYIKNELSALLDISTFHLTGSSHPVEYRITNDQTAMFNFPESVLNFSNPDGFVSFEITPVSTISNGEHIYNNALIYLENPRCYPTNTTLNTILTECPSPNVQYPDVVCPETPFTVSANSSFFTEYSWMLNDESIGLGPTTECSFGTSSEQITCIASNPLCSSQFPFSPILGPVEPVALDIADGYILATSGFESYTWYFQSELILDQTASSLLPQEEGLYTIVAIDSDGCVSTADISYLGNLEVPSATLQLYPNPTTDMVRVTNPIPDGDTFIEIFNANGQLVYHANFNSQSIEINISHLEAGMYCVKVDHIRTVMIKQ